MSTLPPSVRARSVLPWRLLVALSCLVQGGACAETGPRAATADEVHEVTARISSVFADLDDFPEAQVSTTKLEKKMYWSTAADDALLLVPVTVRFRGLTNSYCRLVTVSAKSRELNLVKVSAQANFDDCSGIDQIRYVDVNGDGLLDVIETVKVKSNVQDGQVATALVYLSSSQHVGGYCYSAAASRQLAPIDLKSDMSVTKAMATARQRLGAAQFDCEH